MSYILNVTTNEYEGLQILKRTSRNGEDQQKWMAGLHLIFGEAVVDQWLLLSREKGLTLAVHAVPEIPYPPKRLWRFHDAQNNPLIGSADTLFVPKFTLRPNYEEDV